MLGRGIIVALLAAAGCTAFGAASPVDAGAGDRGEPDPGASVRPCPDPSQYLCGTTCVSTGDPRHGCAPGSCAACPSANGFAACRGDACVVAGCVAGFRDCDGDPANGCESPASTATCAECTQGHADCDRSGDCETDTLSDRANCGRCGNACAGGGVCAGGTCHLAACKPGEEVVVLRLTAETFRTPDSTLRVSPAGRTTPEVLGDRGDGDADETYAEGSAPSTAERLRFSHEPLTLPRDHRIARVIARARMRRTEAAGVTESGLGLGYYFTERAKIPALDPAWNSGWRPGERTYSVESFEKEVYPWAPTHAWSVDNVNALEIHVIFNPKSATNKVRVTQAWLEVCHVGP